jgi:hypothetical protein
MLLRVIESCIFGGLNRARDRGGAANFAQLTVSEQRATAHFDCFFAASSASPFSFARAPASKPVIPGLPSWQGVLANCPVRSPSVDFGGTWLRKCRRILDPELIENHVRPDPRETLHQMHILVGPADRIPVTEICRINHQHLALPVTARIPHPCHSAHGQEIGQP